jgi:dehydrogenase/reductase SDR family protein 7B
MYFKNKTIWITGASSGLGESLAYELAKRGAKLVLSARNADRLASVAQKCLEQGAPIAHIAALDLERHDEIERVAEGVLHQFPKIDILINNGGISQRALASETDWLVDKRIMDINYLGTVILTKAVLPSMKTHRLGHIVAISSLVGKFGTPLRSSYAASKHALHGFFDSMRAELVNDNINITIICPGFIHTRISYNALTKDGSPQNTLDQAQANGMSPERFAQKALRAIEKKKREAYIGGKEVLAIYLNRISPALVARMVSKVKVT